MLAVTDSCTRKVLAFAILNSSYGPLIDSSRFLRYCNSARIPVGGESKKESNAAGCNALLPSHIKLPIYILYLSSLWSRYHFWGERVGVGISPTVHKLWHFKLPTTSTSSTRAMERRSRPNRCFTIHIIYAAQGGGGVYLYQP